MQVADTQSRIFQNEKAVQHERAARRMEDNANMLPRTALSRLNVVK